MDTTTKLHRCGSGVTGSGGYWCGSCRRPVGHSGNHRQWPTVADKTLAVALTTAFKALHG